MPRDFYRYDYADTTGSTIAMRGRLDRSSATTGESGANSVGTARSLGSDDGKTPFEPSFRQTLRNLDHLPDGTALIEPLHQ
jgi:hypothetical protein